MIRPSNNTDHRRRSASEHSHCSATGVERLIQSADNFAGDSTTTARVTPFTALNAGVPADCRVTHTEVTAVSTHRANCSHRQGLLIVSARFWVIGGHSGRLFCARDAA